MQSVRLVTRVAALFLTFASGSMLMGQAAEKPQPVSPALMLGSTALLNGLWSQPHHAIPVAVLNRTRCISILWFVRKRNFAEGVISCRIAENNWSQPLLVRLEASAKRRHPAPDMHLLVFTLDPHEADSIFSTGLELSGKNSSAGPIARGAAVILPDQRLSANVSYLLRKKSLSQTAVSGRLRSLQKLPAMPSSAAGWNPVPQNPEQKFAFAITSFFNSITPTGVVIHHTAVLPDDGALPGNLDEVDNYHRARGLETVCGGRIFHVAYHYMILPNGRIETGRPEGCQGAHAVGYNTFLGISVVGDFSSRDNPNGQKGPLRPTSKQMRSLIRLCSRLRKRYHIPLARIKRHSDLAKTQCPGDRFPFSGLLTTLRRSH